MGIEINKGGYDGLSWQRQVCFINPKQMDRSSGICGVIFYIEKTKSRVQLINPKDKKQIDESFLAVFPTYVEAKVLSMDSQKGKGKIDIGKSSGMTDNALICRVTEKTPTKIDCVPSDKVKTKETLFTVPEAIRGSFKRNEMIRIYYQKKQFIFF